MKKIALIIFVLGFILSSCEKTSEGVSTVTTYAEMSLTGGEAIFWPMNTPFVEPGYTATEGESDITADVVVKSNVAVDAGGKYSISYTVANSDGFTVTKNRTVYVYDTNAPLNGWYDSKIKREYNGATANRGPYSILMFGVGNNEYWIEDLLGGWYYIGSGYGEAYAGAGVIRLKIDNTFEIVSAEPLAWGYPCEFYAPSSYNLLTGDIILKTIMEDVPTMLFTVTLNNPQSLN
jgi:hypothetical protein